VEPRHHVVVVAEDLAAVTTDTPVRVAATSTLDDVSDPDVVAVGSFNYSQSSGGATTVNSSVAEVLAGGTPRLSARHLADSPCARSAMMSAESSMPTERRTTSSPAPAASYCSCWRPPHLRCAI